MPAGVAYVAEASGITAGYIATYEKDAGQFIENVAVHPDHQGEGLAGLVALRGTGG